VKIKRTGKSTTRVTHGKIYGAFRCNSAWFITDDCGRNMQPSLKDPWWVIVTEVEEKKEVKIKTGVTLVNGVDSDTLSMEDILHMIKQEKNQIEKLTSLGVESKAVDKLIEKHSNNVETLVEVLDNNSE
jgi:hypothetical protein